jgi:TRAP-type mannitol/chloroaromatic compound transport system permease large subunit
MVGWIIAGASCFGAVFSGVGGKRLIADIATAMPGGDWGVLTLALIFVLFLGMFLETAALIMLAAPLVSPLIAELGFDPLWWGLVFNTALQVAFLSPPFGFALFYLKGVSNDMTIQEIYTSALPFLGLQLAGLALIIFFPPLAIWLPQTLMK